MTCRVEELLRLDVRLPARYAGGEFFAEPPRAPAAGDLRVALVFPDAYEVGMSNAGLAILYSLLRRTAGVFVDRFFAPWQDLEAAIRAGRAGLCSRDLGLPMDGFHVVGVSLPFELTYTTALNLLDLGGVGLRSDGRSRHGPLVVAGGPGAAHPEPLAPFFDAFLVGEGEALLPPFLEALRRLGFPAAGRGEVLPRLEEIPGVYVPSLHPVVADPVTGFGIVPDLRVRRLWLQDLDASPDLRPFPVPAVEAVFDRVSLEIARGCPQGCRFCEAGIFYRPFRERATDALILEARTRLGDSGMEEVGLASLSTADRRDLDGLVVALAPVLAGAHASLSVSSLRAYGVGEEVLRVMAEGRTSSLTLAPEAGRRLRGVINKNVEDSDLFVAVDRMCRAGWNRVKLYFMLGLPGETPEDVREIGRLAREVRAIGRSLRGARFRLVVSCSLFVPRPHTPLQWAAMAGPRELEARIALLKEEIPRDVELRTHDPAASRLEAIIARGDRDVAALLEEAWRRGARFDAWSERFDRGLWAAAEDATLRSPERYLGTLDPAAALPWDHVDLGVTKRWLQGEWARALEGVMSPACDPRGTPPRCTGCGVGCLPAGDLRGGGSPVTAERAEPPAGDPPPPAEAVTPIRIRYRRVPPATVLGHLDLQRSLCRGLRRAGLPLEHTRGYHPRLKTSAGPSLPLGAWGLDEWLEVGFLGQPAEGWGALAPALQRVMIDGIEILDVAPRGPGPKPPAPTAFEWLVRLGRAPVAGELAAARIRWARDGLSCDRKGARRDLAAAVLDVEVALHLPAGVPPAAGALRLRLRAEAAPRPEEIVMDLGFSREELLSVIRVGATPS